MIHAPNLLPDQCLTSNDIRLRNALQVRGWMPREFGYGIQELDQMTSEQVRTRCYNAVFT